ncbi:hypothetical protein AGMMS49921_02720 [Endomicrobiia bacterium]|nr:hypothetical protein AGMMS49921_02720 [Endomicrobiia bacterium]
MMITLLCVVGYLKIRLALSKKTDDDAKAISSLSDKEVSKVEIKNNTLAQTIRNKSTNTLTTKKTYIPQGPKVTINYKS